MRRIAICVLACCLGLCTQASGQGGGTITTVAGGPVFTFPANVTVALNAPLGDMAGVAVDSQGNIYVADASNNQVFLISPAGSIRIVAGNGSSCGFFFSCGGFSGDGGPATSASLSLSGPSGVAVDATGNLFIADFGNGRVRKVSPSGIITTVAGGGNSVLGDGGPATSASLYPTSVAVDAAGDLFIADSGNNRIRKVSPSGIITTVAGGGNSVLGDGGPATSALLYPTSVAVDAAGDLFIADIGNNRIRKVSASGIITTVAGGGDPSDGLGDGGPATSASLNYPEGVAVDVYGNLFIADTSNNRVREVSSNGMITTMAGNDNYGFSGDGGPATSASLSYPAGVAVDATGNVFIADYLDLRIREVSASGIITTIAGDGKYGASGDGGPATSATFNNPGSVAVDATGNLFIVDIGNNRIREVSAGGIITTVAGNGAKGFSGDGGPATTASLSLSLYYDEAVAVAGVAVDTTGNLFIADAGNGRVRKVSTGGVITTVAGSGAFDYVGEISPTFSGDGGPATSASLDAEGVAVDASGNLFIADSANNRIRKVSTDGIITTVAGGGSPSDGLGDGGPATLAELYASSAIAVDAFGNLFIADGDRIRKVSADGIITTVAGGGSPSDGLGDGGPATSASLLIPEGVAVDAFGNLFIADTFSQRVREVSTSGVITTVAGDGNYGASGDGGPSTSASLNYPSGVAVDAFGNLFIADSANNRIREVFAPALSPSAQTSGATDGAGFSARISHGGIGSIFGTNLAPTATATSSLPLPGVQRDPRK